MLAKYEIEVNKNKEHLIDESFASFKNNQLLNPDLPETIEDSRIIYLEAIRLLGVRPSNIKILSSKEDYDKIASTFKYFGEEESKGERYYYKDADTLEQSMEWRKDPRMVQEDLMPLLKLSYKFYSQYLDKSDL
jgi:hypothetical protein